MAKAATKKVVEIQIVRTLTPKQWQENPGLQQKLRAALESDIIQLAFQTLLLQAMPNAAPSSTLVPGVTAEAIAQEGNNRYHNRSGFAQFHRALNKLTLKLNQPDTKPAWGVLKEEDE